MKLHPIVVERLRIALAGQETRIRSRYIPDADKRELPLELGSPNALVAFLADEAPLSRAPEFRLYPTRFGVGGRTNDTLMRELFT